MASGSAPARPIHCGLPSYVTRVIGPSDNQAAASVISRRIYDWDGGTAAGVARTVKETWIKDTDATTGQTCIGHSNLGHGCISPRVLTASMVRLENCDRRQRADSHDRRTLLGERGHCVLGCSVMSSIGLPGAARRTQPATRLMIVLYSKATIGDNGRTGKWLLTVRTALERWAVPASMFVSPRVVPAGGWVVPASVSTTAWTQYQVTWAIDPVGQLRPRVSMAGRESLLIHWKQWLHTRSERPAAGRSDSDTIGLSGPWTGTTRDSTAPEATLLDIQPKSGAVAAVHNPADVRGSYSVLHQKDGKYKKAITPN